MPNLSASSVATAFLVGVTSATLAVARADRAELRLVNRGPNDLYIGINAAAVATQGWVVPNGQEHRLEYTAGLVTGITGGSAFVHILDTPHG